MSDKVGPIERLVKVTVDSSGKKHYKTIGDIYGSKLKDGAKRVVGGVFDALSSTGDKLEIYRDIDPPQWRLFLILLLGDWNEAMKDVFFAAETSVHEPGQHGLSADERLEHVLVVGGDEHSIETLLWQFLRHDIEAGMAQL